MNRPLASGLHVATLAYVGRIWEVYLEIEDNASESPQTHRARLRFDLESEPGVARADSASVWTGIMIIEASREEVIAKARSFDQRLLADLARSALSSRDRR
jgi:hypothetical protein